MTCFFAEITITGRPKTYEDHIHQILSQSSDPLLAYQTYVRVGMNVGLSGGKLLGHSRGRDAFGPEVSAPSALYHKVYDDWNPGLAPLYRFDTQILTAASSSASPRLLPRRNSGRGGTI